MKNEVIALLTMLLFLTNAFGQEIKGRVINEANEPLPYATIKLISPSDSTTIAGGVTKEDGTFALPTHGHSLPLLLEASLIGYTTEQVQYLSDAPMTLTLKESTTMLDEVAITADRITHKLVAGGLSTTIEGSPLSQLTDIYSVLRGIPLVEVENDKVKVTGKGTPIIYINDRKMTDPNQLRTLRPHLIKDIQVITNPGAKYSSSVSAVIKIYTRREPGTGLSGEIEMMADKYMDRDLGYLPYISLNYRHNNWDFFGTTWYNHWRGLEHNPEITFIGKIKGYEWENKSNLLGHYDEDTYSLTLGTNYEDELQSAGFRYRFYVEKTRNLLWSYLSSSLDNADPVDYYSLSESQDPWSYTHRPSLYYLRKIGDWKAQIDIDYYHTTPTHEKTMTREGHTEQYELRTLNGETGNQSQSLGVRIDAEGPLWGGSLNTGGEFSWVNNHFFVYNDKELNLPDLNNQFREDTYTLYTEYNRAIAEKYMLTVGLRMEHVKSHYLNKDNQKRVKEYRSTHLFPTLSIGGQLWGVNTQLSFRSTINRPSYWRLQPDYQYLTRFEYQVGDPNLRPERNYTTQLMLNKNWVTLMLSHSYIMDQLTQETHPMYEIDDPTKLRPYTSLLKHINAKPYNTFDATLVLSPKIKWWQPNFFARFSQIIGYDLHYLDKVETHRDPTIILGLNNQLTLPYDIYATANIAYMFAKGTAQGNIILLEPFIQGSASISKKWLKDKSLTTSLTLINFNTRNTVLITTPYTSLTTHQRNVPRLQFTVSYRFNTTKDKYKGKGSLGSVINRM